jgi:hypothetical protein
LSLFLLLQYKNIFSQSLTLEKSYLNTIYRNQQLLDTSDTDVSFTIRPIILDSNINNKTFLNKTTKALPLIFRFNNNNNHPFGINLGSLYPTRGSQFYISGGLYTKYKKFKIQIQPEFVYAENLNFRTFPNEHYDPIWDAYYKWYNKIDLIEKFGDKSLNTIFLGQSKLEYDINKNISLKLSSENIWWGPGVKQGLVLTNNSNGFLHFGLQTIKPIKTKYGSFEGQFIFGNLKNSNVEPTYKNKVFHNKFLYNPKLNEQRFITGLILTFHPKILKGLYIGTANTSIAYYKDANNFFDFLPLNNIINPKIDKLNKRANLGSLFARYIFHESNSEIYFEYGRSDKYPTLFNLLDGKTDPRGFIAGFRTISKPTNRKYRFSFMTEFVQLDAIHKNQVTNVESWYTNNYIRQGFTNNGKVLGAGIGPGSTSQMFDLSILYPKSIFGITMTRIVNNRDFYFNAYQDYVNWKSHWVDLSTTFHANFNLNKKITIITDISFTNSLNYNWWFLPLTDPILPGRGYDTNNITSNIMMVYNF